MEMLSCLVPRGCWSLLPPVNVYECQRRVEASSTISVVRNMRQQHPAEDYSMLDFYFNCVLSAFSDYDGGDCCECTCESSVPFSCGVGDDADYNCIDPSAPCVNDLVDAGTKTTVSVSANGYDARPGEGSDDNGCMENGCQPGLTRDGISADVESRWSCSQAIVDGENLCQIDFTFEDPQDIVDVEVAFWKADERDRTLEVSFR